MTRPATTGTRRKGTVRCAIYTRKSSEEGLVEISAIARAYRWSRFRATGYPDNTNTYAAGGKRAGTPPSRRESEALKPLPI